MRNYTYDVFGNKTTMMTYRNESLGPDSGDVTTWLYDEASGAMTNKVYADGKGPTYSYTPEGKLSRRVWARGIVTDYTYDGWGNLTNTVYSDNTPTISLSYDAFGRQIEAHDAAGITTFFYDSFGSLTNETVIGVAGTNTIIRHWDNYGRSQGYSLVGLAAPCQPQCQSTLAYDLATGRLATMLANGSGTPFIWNYLAGSNLKSSLAYPNGLTASWQYDANNQLLQVRNASPTNVISQYDYTYDAAGRRVMCAKSGSAFTQDDTISYGYNARSELTNAVAAVDTNYRYSYAFDDIGNRKSSSERGTNSVYMANNLNQYTVVDDSTPQFDDDGNQTLIQTSTGIWSVNYNGENRPILWTCQQSDNQTITNNQTISMSYDRMGRRITKNDQRFVYDGYLQIANFEHQTSNIRLQTFVWDPTEPVATHLLVWLRGTSAEYYVHDGNKNVSETIAANGMIAVHYEYAPFGALAAKNGESASENPFRFSSEYADDTLGLVYYNYRHYEPVMGRWLVQDPEGEVVDLNLRCMLRNIAIHGFDYLGLSLVRPNEDGSCPKKCCGGKMIQLVPIWHCTRKLGGTGATNLWLFNHQYICCDNSNVNCFGVQKYRPSCMKECASIMDKRKREECEAKCIAKKGDVIEPEVSTTGTCEKRCVSPTEKTSACNRCAKMPEDYAVGPGGVDCQEWSDDVTTSKCK